MQRDQKARTRQARHNRKGGQTDKKIKHSDRQGVAAKRDCTASKEGWSRQR